MSILLEFLARIPKGQPIEVNGPDFYFPGVLVAFDERHMVLQGPDGMCLIKLDEITDIQWYPVVEVICPLA